MSALDALDAALLLPFTFAIGIWVAWSDVKFMKIPNKAVIALALVWLIFGLILTPWQVWAWGIALGAIALAISFALTMIGLVGAGDAKFAAAMAPFFVQSSPSFVMVLIGACVLGAFGAHRLSRAIPRLRQQTADWESWTHSDFPMGLALVGILNIHLLFIAFA